MREIIKQALTIALFINEIEDDIAYNKHNIPDAKIRLVKKIVEKFLSIMKETGYDKVTDQYNQTYYERIMNHLDRKKDGESTAIYLTYIQMQFHDFCRHYLPERMGYDDYRRNVKKVSYYKSTLEMLMR